MPTREWSCITLSKLKELTSWKRESPQPKSTPSIQEAYEMTGDSD